MLHKILSKATLIGVIISISSAFVGYEYGISSSFSSRAPSQTDKTKPILTVAGIVYVKPENKYALIQRGKEPKGLAMFGGHVEPKESPEEALIREAKEELNIDITNLELIGLQGKYGRDPRQHSVEGTYSCITSQIPFAGSDAKSVILYSLDEIKNLLRNKNQTFAFDHKEILIKFFKKEVF